MTVNLVSCHLTVEASYGRPPPSFKLSLLHSAVLVSVRVAGQEEKTHEINASL